MYAGPEIEKIGIKKGIKQWEDRRREGREVEEIRQRNNWRVFWVNSVFIANQYAKPKP